MILAHLSQLGQRWCEVPTGQVCSRKRMQQQFARQFHYDWFTFSAMKLIIEFFKTSTNRSQTLHSWLSVCITSYIKGLKIPGRMSASSHPSLMSLLRWTKTKLQRNIALFMSLQDCHNEYYAILTNWTISLERGGEPNATLRRILCEIMHQYSHLHKNQSFKLVYCNNHI